MAWSSLIHFYFIVAVSWLLENLGIAAFIEVFFGLTVLYSDAPIEPFPLMDLPPELIVKILRCMPIVDRLKARVNRTLYNLEASEQYFAKEMVIAREGYGYHCFEDEDIPMRLQGTWPALRAGIAKLAGNVYIDSLMFRCEHPETGVLIPHVKSIRCFRFKLHFAAQRPFPPMLGEEYMTDASLLEWVGHCKFFTVYGNTALTGDSLHQLFTDMENGRSSLLSFQLQTVPGNVPIRMIHLLGITRVNGNFHSTRRDVFEVIPGIQTSYIDGFYLIVVGSKMRITFEGRAYGGIIIDLPGEFTIERHNEDGTVPNEYLSYYSYSLTIQEIRTNSRKFVRVPVTYTK